jgi:hypothetical protein
MSRIAAFAGREERTDFILFPLGSMIYPVTAMAAGAHIRRHLPKLGIFSEADHAATKYGGSTIEKHVRTNTALRFCLAAMHQRI